MASASSTLRVKPFPKGTDNNQRRQYVYGTCILSPSGTYLNTSSSASGIPLNWGNMQDGNFANLSPFIPAASSFSGSVKPENATFFSVGGLTTLPGYTYVYNKPTTGSTTLRILNAGTELTNNAAITADNIEFEAEFIRGL